MSDREPDLFDICARRHRGDEMSRAANLATDKPWNQDRVMQFLATVPDATCDEAEVALDLPHQTCSARFSELKRRKWIVPTTKRPTRTGCLARAWKVSVEQ
ncbi:MAG: hypothetical protein FJ276_31210 [Planctomycetes bacterium]|nr:hypothetical protein [Planctomycetota bacterium]